jgi:phosphoglucomutase/phosphomannomutase
LYWQFGYHAESQFSLTMPGAAGMQDMQKLMARLRSDPPAKLAGFNVVRMRDYKSLTERVAGGNAKPFQGPSGDMVMLDLSARGNYIAVRPSGTEPKVKFYTFSYEPAEQIANLDDTKAEIGNRLKAVEVDLSAFARSV